MNTSQRVALAVAVANLALLMVFPPYDYVSLQHGNIPTFDGFYFAFGNQPNRVLNANFLALELIVVAINACIAILLLRDSAVRTGPERMATASISEARSSSVRSASPTGR